MKIDMRPCPDVTFWAGYRSDHLRDWHAGEVQKAHEMQPPSMPEDDG